jgi:hypothetical protein
MAKRGHRTTLDRVLLAITALFVLGGFMALGFLKNVSQENRALLVMISSLGMFAGLASLLLVSVFWRRLRKWTWQRAMASWIRSSHAGIAPKSAIKDSLAEGELRQLASKYFSRIGYRITGGADGGVYLTLINPEGRIELVVCKQESRPIELHHIYSLELEMRRTKAVRGFFWATGGFSGETIDWVAHRSIVLADTAEIGRFIDCAEAKGSRLLEH